MSSPLTVNAGDGSNAINYSVSSFGATLGAVSVDNFETINFTNKTTLTLNGEAGDDNINLNNPSTPTGLTSIVVNGGDPTASDTLLITGTGGTDTVVFTPTGYSSGSLTGLGAPITFATTEHVTYDGNDAAALDNVTINGTLINDTFDYDASLLQGSFRSFISPEFNILRSARISVNGGGGGFDVANLVGSAGVDTVTSAANAITILTPGSLALITLGVGMDAVTVSTLAGDDSVNLSGLAAPLTSTTVYGGDDDDQLTGSPLSDTIYGGFGNDVIVGGAGADAIYGEAGNDSLNGSDGDDVLLGGDDFDIITISGATPGNDTVSGDTGGDWLLFDPTPATVISLRESAGRLRVDTGANVTLSTGISQVLFNSTGAVVTMTVHDLSGVGVDRVGIDFNGAGLDNLIVEGTAGADVISVGRELHNPAGEQLATVNLAWGRVSSGVISAAAGDRITVNGMDGDDTIIASQSVMSAAIVPGSVGDALVTLNGGNGNDVLTIASPAGQTGNTIDGGAGNDAITGGLGDDEFDGGAGDDTFVGGGGTDRVGGGAGASIGDAILVTGTSGNDTITLTLNATGHLLATVNGVTTTYTNFLSGPIATSGIEGILVEGLGGDDQVTVDSTNGAVPVAITYNGGADSDTLTLTGGIASSNTYSVGPDVGSGSSVLVIGGVTQTVQFTGLEPVIDLVGGPLVVNGTNANNAINYSQGSVAANGLVSVDGFESIEFSNKTSLSINALAGDDTININNPATPLGLLGITVDGGDPTASDTLLITGTGGTDTVVFTPTGYSSGSLTGLGAPITFATTEHVTYDGNDAAALDNVTINGTLINDTFDYDASLLQGSFRSFISPEFNILRSARISVNGGGGGFDVANLVGSAGVDTVTSAANAITINTPGSLAIITLGAGMDAVTLSTLAGDDSVNLSGLAAPITSTTVYGGDGNDQLNGSPLSDLIYGGFGNDVIVGGAGADVGYGEAGNDRFGDPSVADPAANDSGNDQFFGGDGSDTLTWDAGDGSDLFEGGTGEDVMIFNGSGGAETFTFNANGTRLEFLRSLGGIDMDLAEVEQVNLNANGAADAVNVNDLFGTGVSIINVNLGSDGAVDAVNIQGRSV